MVDHIAEVFVSFIARYGGFFRAGAHDNAGVVQRYRHGLVQAATATFVARVVVVDGACEQRFRHFISNSTWRHETVIEQIGRDADRLHGGKPDSALIVDS